MSTMVSWATDGLTTERCITHPDGCPDGGRIQLSYSRLSLNRNEKDSVARGLRDCRARAMSRGNHIVAEFTDDNISAYTGKERPGYDAALEFTRDHADVVNDILIPHPSRLTRNRTQRAELFSELIRLRVGIDSLSGGSIDLADPMQALTADLMGSFDTAESAVKGYRVREVCKERAAMGKAHGRILYGWRRVSEMNARGLRVDWHDVEEPRSASIVREIVERICDGESTTRIARDLTARQEPTPAEAMRLGVNDEWKGTAGWTGTMVRQLSTRPANVGKRVGNAPIGADGKRGKGVIIGDADWPAIVDPAKHARVLAHFAASSAATGYVGARRSDRRYLLTFGPDYTCGVCGAMWRMKRRSTGPRDLLSYQCTGKGCTTRAMDDVDDYVTGLLLSVLADPKRVAVILRHNASTVDVSALIAERDALQKTADEFAGLIGLPGGPAPSQLVAFNVTNQPRIDALAAQIEREASKRGSKHIGPLTREQWNALDVTEQRELLEACRVRVRLLPSRSGYGFKPETVEVEIYGVSTRGMDGSM